MSLRHYVTSVHIKKSLGCYIAYYVTSVVPIKEESWLVRLYCV